MDSCQMGCMHCHHRSCTKKVPIFSTLNDEEISSVSSLIRRRAYEKGEMVVMEGESLESLFIINEGQVKAFRDTMDGREQILYIFSEGDFFGEKNLLMNQEAGYNVEALAKTHICMIIKKDFQALVEKFPSIALKVMEALSERMDRLENAISSMGSGTVEARINAVLLEFAKKYGRQKPEGTLIDLPLSREGIANYIGLTRETVSRKLSALQDGGVIDMIGNKKILLKDLKALEETI